jgi:hypothetical protein
MPRSIVLALCLWIGLAFVAAPALAAPPGPEDLTRSIETSRKAIAEFEKTIRDYDDEMRKTVANDPTSSRRRQEIRIIKRYYVQEIEGLKGKIIADYKKLREYRASGVQEAPQNGPQNKNAPHGEAF